MTVTLEDLLDKLWFESKTTTEKGSAFEALIASFLRTAPEFADRFEDVYLWNDWPERGKFGDHGIDIVAKDIHSGGWCAVQAKFYDPQAHVNKKDIDSFLAAASNKVFTSKLIVSTTASWGPTAKHVLDGADVTRIGLSDLLESKVDWEAIDWRNPLPEVLPTTGKKTPRPHQREALKDIRAGFTDHDRGQLIMACGTGKTFTSLKAAEEVATGRKDRASTILFLVPSIQLLNQTLREWKQESEIPFRAFAVCSDVKVGKHSTSEDLSVHDLVVPATTDTAKLAADIATSTADEQLTVVFSTYQSIDVVAAAQAAGVPDFDLIICDEAHRTTGVTLAGEDESAFVRVHDSDYLRGAKRLYMTATPRLFNPETKDKAAEGQAVLASMDNEDLYGPIFHRLGFGDAVERDLLTDYKVLVLTVDEEYVARNFQTEMAAAGEIPLGEAAKIIGCWNGLAKQFGHLPDDEAPADLTPMRRAVAFAQSIKASKAATTAFPELVDRHLTATDSTGEGASGDDLRVEARHVDGTMNALERGDLLTWLKEGPAPGEDVCRILSNARCLSEGVDVPALDAVMFLTPRGSQVDIVQSVGRVMRKAAGKDLGYIILPVVVPAGASPEQALADNKRFQAVWQVLQALRAHDDRFNAMVNKLDLNKKKSGKIDIFHVGGRGETAPADDEQLELAFDIDGWRDAIYARIVKKVGERRYWPTWVKDVADIAEQHRTRILGLLADPESNAAKEFAAFLDGLRGNLNDGITEADAVEMLAQHLVTRPVFEALFAGYDFAASNPVAQTMERMLSVLDEHSLESENQALHEFYSAVRSRVSGVDNAEGRQRIIVDLYDNFFTKAFSKTADKLGIVYTPVEIVDFILRSADAVLNEHFGQRLTDEGVHILDGFTGTGTFMVRLLQLGLIDPHDLARKYAQELHANEILLLAYYIAAVNIETTYQDLRAGTLEEAAQYEPFPGLVLTDTFQSYEDGDDDDLGVFPENNERINRQRELPITVILGNPPYSSGQDSANDNNANEKYPHLDAAIRDTFAAMSSGDNPISLYDSYIRAIKWASLRIQDRGVIAYVTNGGWLDSNTADGMRIALAEEFSHIYVYNLRGNQRTAGEQSRKEGGKIFGAGSRATVAITILVKNYGQALREVRAEAGSNIARIRYTDIGDYLSREEKLVRIAEAEQVTGLEAATLITPNQDGDWLSQRTTGYKRLVPCVGEEGAIFRLSSQGVTTSRDAWVYSSGRQALRSSVERLVATFNAGLVRGTAIEEVPTKDINWSRKLRKRYERRRPLQHELGGPRQALYRPFTKQHLHFDIDLVEVMSQTARLFPTPSTQNLGIYQVGSGSAVPFSVIATDSIPDLHLTGAGSSGQFFARWRYERVDGDPGMLDLNSESEVDLVDGYRRVDNISEDSLATFRKACGDWFTKDDVFHYVYGLLHSPDYREAYAADLKKSLPRIPVVVDAAPFVNAGKRLMQIHLGYESATPFALDGAVVDCGSADAFAYFAVRKKMQFGKPTADQKAAGERHDRSVIHYNDRISLTGIPLEAYRYMLGSRSAIEWIIDRYYVKTDTASGIVNDPNDWSREVNDPRYIIDLLARIVTVSLETMRIVDSLPSLEVRS